MRTETSPEAASRLLAGKGSQTWTCAMILAMIFLAACALEIL